MPENPYMRNPETSFVEVSELSRDQARKQVDQLREAIDFHDYRYYVKADPVIADEGYDRLFRRLKALEAAFPELQSDTSPTMRVGAPPLEVLQSVEHVRPMLSLESAYERDEVAAFYDFLKRELGEDRLAFHVEPKLDGISVEVVYQNGTFVRGSTRGDGVTGEDISRNLKTINSLPLRLQGAPPDFLALRGEVLMHKSDFQQMNRRRVQNNERPLANPRNAAAGTVRQLDPNNVADKPLDVYFYELLDSSGEAFQTHEQMMRALPEWGFKPVPRVRVCATVEEIEQYREELLSEREEIDFEADGIVIKLNDRPAREEVGTRQRNPRWALAWKFPARKEVTLLRDIVVQVGRTGTLTPVALLDPVEIGGVTVSRATLHNEGLVHEKDLRPGDRVRVQRAGDVIPQVIERVEAGKNRPAEKFHLPETCPVCGTAVRREGAYVICPNGLACRAQLEGHVVHYASRAALDIETLGEKNAKQLIERGLVKTLADIYDLSVEDLEQLEGFAQKSARKLHSEIQGTKEPRLDRFLYALGIRQVGEHVARVLAQSFGSLENVRQAEVEDLSAVHEIGDEIADSVYDFFHRQENVENLDRILSAGVAPKLMPKRDQQPLQGATIVFTGDLESYTRSEAKEKVEALGARATSSVSGNTDYVVVGASPGSKLDQARKRGNVTILDEQQFKELIGEA